MSGSLLRWLLTNVMGQNPSVQQLSLIRKLIYLGLILALFTVSYFFRTTFTEARAVDLALRDRDVGEVELTGSALRLSLTGLRGLATCVIWVNATDKQKKGQWEELDLLATSATKLQPHFNTPWQFQSWNLAFNVVNRCDRPGDKYFYIARGLQLLGDGERQNRFNPELRSSIGQYYQMRIGRWEYGPIMHSLMELSCIDPLKRESGWLKQKAKPDDSQSGTNFEEYFCSNYPRLVRRLREPINPRNQKPMVNPDEILRFLDEHKDIPALFKIVQTGNELKAERKKNKEQPFPVFPQGDAYNPELAPDPKYLADKDNDVRDVYLAAWTWFEYSLEPLPAPDPNRPGDSQPIEDPIRQQVPKTMTTLLFRDKGARALSFVAERLAEEGWFDKSGWEVSWEGAVPTKPLILGEGIDWGHDSWRRAFEDWEKFGVRTGINLRPEEIQSLNAEAALYRRTMSGDVSAYPVPPPDPDQQMQDSFKAHDRLHWYEYYRRLSNFAHHFNRAKMEMKDTTVAARKALYDAQQAERRGSREAINRFEVALGKWRAVLASDPDFAADSEMQTQTKEIQKKYTESFHRTPLGERFKECLLVEALLNQVAMEEPGILLTQTMRAVRPRIATSPDNVVYPPKDEKWKEKQAIVVESVIAQAASGPGTLPWLALIRMPHGPPAIISPDGPLDDYGWPLFLGGNFRSVQ